MDCFATLEHGYEFRNLARPRLGFFDVADSVQDCVAISTVQCCKECGRLRVVVQGLLEVDGYFGPTRRGVGALPPTICLSGFDLREARRSHAALLDERQRSVAVQRRPLAARFPWREANKPVLVVILFQLSIDPSVTERSVNRFCFRQFRSCRRLLGELNPNANRISWLSREPPFERPLIREAKNWQA